MKSPKKQGFDPSLMNTFLKKRQGDKTVTPPTTPPNPKTLCFLFYRCVKN